MEEENKLKIRKKRNKPKVRWTKEENELLEKGAADYGRDWKKVANYVGTRNSMQARSHAQKYFNKLSGKSIKVKNPVKTDPLIQTPIKSDIEETSQRIFRYEKIIMSLQNIYMRLKIDRNDPLLNIEITQGKILLNEISDKLKEIQTDINFKKSVLNLSKMIEETKKLINEICPGIKGMERFHYLNELV